MVVLFIVILFLIIPFIFIMTDAFDDKTGRFINTLCWAVSTLLAIILIVGTITCTDSITHNEIRLVETFEIASYKINNNGVFVKRIESGFDWKFSKDKTEITDGSAQRVEIYDSTTEEEYRTVYNKYRYITIIPSRDYFIQYKIYIK